MGPGTLSEVLATVGGMTAEVPWLVLVDGQNLLWRAAFGFPARIRTRTR